MYVGPDDPIFAGRFPGRGGMGGDISFLQAVHHSLVTAWSRDMQSRTVTVFSSANGQAQL